MSASSRKLIVHIGNHKTGATSIQRALFRNKRRLAKMGIRVYNQSRDGKLHTGDKVTEWINSPPGDIYPGFSQSLSAHVGNVIVSLEDLSWVFDRKIISRFQSELAEHFDDIKIIAYLRRQDKQAVSHHQQGSKASGYKAAKFYGNRPKALPDYKPRLHDYLNYYQRIGYWADAFGDANISLRIFERDLFTDGDVVSDFIATTGIKIQSDFVNKNISVGFLATKIGHLMQQKKLNPGISAVLLENLGTGGKMLPSAQEAMDFYAYFRDSNKCLNDRFRISELEYLFDDDFSSYPSETNDLWTEDTANEAILALLTTVNQLPMFSKEDAALIIECSRKIEMLNPVLARQLRKKISGKPSGPK